MGYYDYDKETQNIISLLIIFGSFTFIFLTSFISLASNYTKRKILIFIGNFVGGIFNMLSNLMSKIFDKNNLRVDKLYGKLKYKIIKKYKNYDMTEYEVVDNSYFEDFYKAVLEKDEEKINLTIVNLTDKQCDLLLKYINETLVDYKKYIIDVLINIVVTTVNQTINMSDLYKNIIHHFLFSYELDHKYTKTKLFEHKDTKNGIIKILFLFFSKRILQQYTNKINKLENENALLKEHIKYQPDSEVVLELMESFNHKAKKIITII
jgi:hypothetical protein